MPSTQLLLTVARSSFPSATRAWLESVLAILSRDDWHTTGGDDLGVAKQLTANRHGLQFRGVDTQASMCTHVGRMAS